MSKKILALISCILIVLCFSACKGEKITLGAYQPIDPASLSDGVGYEVTDGDFTFDFKENGKFSAYLSFGNSIAGDYEVSGKKIICTLVSAQGENAINQATNGKIVFKVLDKENLEIDEISDSYPVLVQELIDGLWYTSDESKDMPLSPLKKGVKFTVK